MKLVHGIHFNNIRGDIYGGITAGVVALPLALAFGVASGAGPMAGLYGAIFVGFFAALFGGTPAQVSGPTGPMTVVMAVVLTKYAHEPALAFTVVMMGGLFQILFGALRLGSYISLVPFTVISGFMSGIGCIIIILQFAPLLGHEIPDGGTIAVLMAAPTIVTDIKWDAALIGALALALAFLTPAKVSRILPAPLIALIVGTAVVWLWLPGVPTLGEIPTGFPKPHRPTFALEYLPDMIGSALILALLGAIDSLLTSLICDNITRTHHESDRELIGQGIGNTIAGVFGGIPGAGATMRSVINIRTGGQTPISGMLHACLLLAVVLGLGPLAGLIPHAVLAGILFKVGIDIIDWGFLKRVPTAPRVSVVLMLMVLLLTVFVDLIMAVAIGVVATSLLFVKRMQDLQAQAIRAAKNGRAELSLIDMENTMIKPETANAIMVYPLSGALSFGCAKDLTRTLVVSDQYKVVILDLTDVLLIDTSASLALEEIASAALDRGVKVLLVGMREPVEKVLKGLGVIKAIGPENCYRTRKDALIRAAALVEGGASVG